MADELSLLQSRLGHEFKDPSLLRRALTHRSAFQDDPLIGENNQRLEFLGDAVLQLVLTQALFEAYPKDREGVLTTKRSRLQNGPFLAALAREIGVDRCLRLGSSEEANGGRSRDSSLEDAFEALIGAVHQDAGLEAARVCVLAVYGNLEARLVSGQPDPNPKGRLQELVQPVHGNDALRYEVVRTEGADHSRTFEVAAYLNDRQIGSGKGPSKKAAEEEAARAALASLKGGPSAAP